MKNYFFAAVFAPLFFLPNEKKFSVKNKTEAIVIFDSEINPRLRKPIKSAVDNYFLAYGCPDTVWIKYGTDCPSARINDSTTKVVLGYTINKKTFICPILDNQSDSVIYWNTCHELFHCLMAKDTSYIEAFTIFGGAGKVIGYSGLSVCIKRKDGVKVMFNGIEEGCAEVCAMNMTPGYMSLTPGYNSVARKVLNFIKARRITVNDLIYFQQNNDVVGFCAKTMNIPKLFVTGKDVEFAIATFMKDF